MTQPGVGARPRAVSADADAAVRIPMRLRAQIATMIGLIEGADASA